MIEIHIFNDNSADPDQMASSKANRSWSTPFAKTGHVVFSKRRVKLFETCLSLDYLNIDTLFEEST